ncbi:hypothetical protein LTR53_013229 [Teratosphaeriaceae sp. CCFEE 6253]|nr:hypothetical protein LTR53_013229 [Teratosphaeriaceae sp. CCFEE 6253]
MPILEVPDAFFERFPLSTLVDADAFVPFRGFDLEDEVCPLFGSKYFVDTDYEALFPALQLASKLLMSDESLRYYHTIFHGDVLRRPYPAGSGCDDDDTYPYAIPPSRALTAREVQEVERELRSFRHILKFYHREIGPDGQCEPRFDSKGDIRLGPERVGFAGWMSKITIDQDNYETIVRLYHQDRGTCFSAPLVFAYVEMARVLCHELAHAAHFWRWGGGPNAQVVVMGDTTMAEAGFDWETMVFGGILSCRDGCIQLREWPGICMLNLCMREALQLCSAEFWQQAEAGHKTLRIPKVVGQRIAPAKCTCDRCSTSEAWDRKDLQRVYELLNVPESASCTARWDYYVPADPQDASPLDCVPDGYVLLGNGFVVSEKDAKKFWEPKVRGHMWVDMRRHRKAKRGVKQERDDRGPIVEQTE